MRSKILQTNKQTNKHMALKTAIN